MSRRLFTRSFWADATERAIKTCAQTGLGVIGADVVTSVGAKSAVIAIGVATVSSLLMSIASAGVGDPNSASLVK